MIIETKRLILQDLTPEDAPSIFAYAQALIDQGFQERGIERIFAPCTPKSIASKSLMLKLGMQYEGCLRKRPFAKARFYDLEHYSILKKEWLG